jgi:hypothetical protein
MPSASARFCSAQILGGNADVDPAVLGEGRFGHLAMTRQLARTILHRLQLAGFECLKNLFLFCSGTTPPGPRGVDREPDSPRVMPENS